MVAIYIDGDHGRNGITSLADQLAAKRCKIAQKAPIKPEATRSDISDVLLQVALMGIRHTRCSSTSQNDGKWVRVRLDRDELGHDRHRYQLATSVKSG